MGRVKYFTDRTEKTELCVLCLVEDGSRILVQNRTKPDWRGVVLPGGHVEKEESMVEAVIREMQEETGLTVIAPRLCGVKQFPGEYGRYLVLLFKTSQFTGTLQSSDEGEVWWEERNNLHNLNLVPDFEAMLSVFDRDDLTEFQYVGSPDQWKLIIR